MYSIKKGFEDKNVFVMGNTKRLSDCNEQEIAVLQQNYRGWFVKKTEENSGGQIGAEVDEVSEEQVDSSAFVTEASAEAVEAQEMPAVTKKAASPRKK